jgi:hypothetical protein
MDLYSSLRRPNWLATAALACWKRPCAKQRHDRQARENISHQSTIRSLSVIYYLCNRFEAKFAKVIASMSWPTLTTSHSI